MEDSISSYKIETEHYSFNILVKKNYTALSNIIPSPIGADSIDDILDKDGRPINLNFGVPKFKFYGTRGIYYSQYLEVGTVLSNIIPSPKGADSIDMILDKDDSALVANMLNISDRGKKEKPCLSLTIFTAECSEIFGIDFIKTANLSNIEALYECVMEENGHSFGKELLHWVINYIKENFSHVKYLQLNDESYIPCNKATNETLDLLSYSIALYCKTWYELNFNAIIIDKSKYDTYKKSIEIYKSPEMKAKINWDDFFLKNILYPFPHDIIIKDINTYKEIYDNSETFPIFFKKLSEYVGKENRCKFFKGWLELFISSYIDIGRKWTIQQSAE